MERLDDIGLCLHFLESVEFPGFSENSVDLSRKCGVLWALLSSSLVANPSGPLPPANAVLSLSAQSVEPLLCTSSASADHHISFGIPLAVQDDLSAPFGPDDARVWHDLSPGISLGLNGSIVFHNRVFYSPEAVEVDYQATISK